MATGELSDADMGIAPGANTSPGPVAAAPAGGAGSGELSDADMGLAPAAAVTPKPVAMGAGRVVIDGKPATANVEAAILSMAKAGHLDPTAPKGSDLNPFGVSPGGPPPPAGAAYVDEDGLHPAAETKPTLAGDIGQGARGVVDTPTAAAEQAYSFVNPGEGLLNKATDTIDQVASRIQALGGGGAPIPGPTADQLATPYFALPNAMTAAVANTPGGRWLAQQPRNSQERYSRVVGQFLPGAVTGGEADAPLVVNGLRRLGAVVVPAVSSEFAGHAAHEAGAPPSVENAVRTGTALVTGGAFGGLTNPAAAKAGVNAMTEQVRPFTAAASPGAAESQAASILAGGATDLPKLRNALTSQPAEIVPGSKPTTFQQTGDLGVGALERRLRTSNPEPFVQRATEQNTARGQALDNLVTGPQGATTADQGAAVRSAINHGETAARDVENRAWGAFGADRSLTGNVTATKTAAADILAERRPTSAELSPDVTSAFAKAQAMPDVAPIADIVALRQNVGAQAAAELRANGRTPTYNMLSRLQSAIDDNLDRSISDKVEADQAAVAAGQMAPEQALATRLNSFVEGQVGQQQTQARAVGGAGAVTPAAGGSASDASPNGAALPASGGPRSLAGNPGVSGSPAEPTFDAAGRARHLAANAATKERASTYQVKPVSDVTRVGPGGALAVPDGAVPGKFFAPGPTGEAAMQAGIKAGGDDVLPTLQDYAVGTIRRASTLGDGTISPAKYSLNMQKYADALRALPEDTRTQLQAVADDLQRAETSNSALRMRGNSNTAMDEVAQANARGGAASQTVLRTLGTVLGGVKFGPFGAVAGGLLGDQVAALRKAGISRVDDLLTRAVLDPDVAKALLAKVPLNREGVPKAGAMRVRTAALMTALGAAKIGAAVQGHDAQDVKLPAPAATPKVPISILAPNAMTSTAPATSPRPTTNAFAPTAQQPVALATP